MMHEEMNPCHSCCRIDKPSVCYHQRLANITPGRHNKRQLLELVYRRQQG